jgi:RNA polymerase sigma factor (sigma-70 family)
MSGPQPRSLPRQIQTLFATGTFSGLSDRQLLERFLASGDAVAEMAFAVLVERHGPMVLGVCRRVLGHSHDAEDAMQATFLVLVKRASAVRVEGSLGKWLFGVATRVASRARSEARRRRTREQSGCTRLEAVANEETTSTVELAELRSIIGEELAHLPARFRAAVITCDLEGASHEEAARRLGVPVGTVKSRLARARARLHRRLTRRGLAAPDLAIAAPLFSPTIALHLVQTTANAARSLRVGGVAAAGSIPARVVALTEGALQAMFFSKLKLAAGALLVLATASAVALSQAPAQKFAEPSNAGGFASNVSAPPVQADLTDDEAEVAMLDRAWADAIPRRDTAFVKRILADDFAGIDPAGTTFTKAGYLSDMGSGAFSNDRIGLEEVKPRVFGDVAVVTSLIKINDELLGGRITNVYVKRQGRWRCVNSHASGRTETFGVVPAPGFGPETIRAMLAKRALIRLGFPCRVEQVFVKVGQTVKDGAPLLSVKSDELAALKTRIREETEQFQRNRKTLEETRRYSKAISKQERTKLEAAQNELQNVLARDQHGLYQYFNGSGRAAWVGDDVNDASLVILRARFAGTVFRIVAEPAAECNANSVLMVIDPTPTEKPPAP